MKKLCKKSSRLKGKTLTFAWIVLCLCILSGSTLAYLIAEPDSISGLFAPGHVACEVTGTFSNNYADNVCIQNTGDTPVYIRASVSINFADKDGQIYANAPDVSNYTITYGSGWKQGPDGYWYYPYPVSSEKTTPALVSTFSALSRSYAPKGYFMTVEVVASAIQASGTSAVVDSWGSGVEKLNGNTLVIKEASGE